MALSDVQQALVSAIAAALFPAGTASPSAVGAVCRAYQGWPVADALERSIKAGQVDVSVFSRPGMSKNTTRYPLSWTELGATAPTMTATVEGNKVTIGGTGGVRQLVGIQTGGTPHVFAATAEETPASAATKLAALIPGASVDGSVITLPGTDIEARTGGYVDAALEVRREWQELQVSIWSPTPALRDAVSSVLDVSLAQLPWLQLADGTAARLLYRGQSTVDSTSKAAIWRRDMLYGVEFGVSAKQMFAQFLFANIATG